MHRSAMASLLPTISDIKPGTAPSRLLCPQVGPTNVSDIHPPSPNPVGALSTTGSGTDDVKVQATSVKDVTGVFITWENLSVSAFESKRKVQILDRLSGYAQPGEVLAIMGPSGCGKSSLLDALAGRLASNLVQTGKILVNGRKQELAFGTSAYVTQDDVLMATLTVKEAIYYSAQLQLPNSLSQYEKRARAEETMRAMGLDGVKDMRIGSGSTKGISGGQRRRVSICLEILTHPQLLFIDEPTSGLDSAASYHVMSRISSLAREKGMTVVGAIHQPSSEVFELFPRLCLLAYGKTVYFGPSSETAMVIYCA
ncbi:ABC transporter G family member 2 [Rhynchospora pubera]|uniref:ABC transporter G family member 2 n=1 Tax=Rhynchospora pubera TaxID=906938 RepID=A0AAV8ESR7_9POAL|nr:ABC transporter G family member 2 [Rhynchospora pubera]